jgi:hypothetical protein
MRALLVVTGALVCAALCAPRVARADKAACFDGAERAQLMRHQHDLLKARDALIACSNDACPAAVRRDCATWLAEVQAAIPSLTIHAKDAQGHDVIDARVTLDGVPVAERLDGIAIQLSPGPHTIRLDARSGGVFEEQILLIEGQKDRLFEATFHDAPVAAPPLPPPPPPAPHASGNRFIVPGILGGVGVVGLGLSTVFELVGQSEYSTMKNGCAKVSNCGQSEVDASKLKLDVLAPVTFGVGAASIVTGAVLLLVRHDPSPAPAAWQIDVTPVAGGGHAVLRFRL